MNYAKWTEKRGTKWSKPFWRKTTTIKTAKQKERAWNQFDNPYDKIKLLKVEKKLPKGLKKDKYGTYWE